MHLHDHEGIDAALFDPLVERDHRALDDVRCRALHRRIDGGALGVLAPRGIAGFDLRKVQTSPEHSLHVAPFPRPLPGLVHELLHTGITGEVEIHVLLGLSAGDAQLSTETEGRHAVDETEVDGFRTATLLVAHLIQGNPENLRRRGPMNVLSGLECLPQALVAGEVRHDPQLDLRVVGRQQTPAPGRDECLPNAPALGCAHGNILQIRLRGREPARGGDGLVIARVHPAGLRIDAGGERVRVGGLELAHASVLEDELR